MSKGKESIFSLTVGQILEITKIKSQSRFRIHSTTNSNIFQRMYLLMFVLKTNQKKHFTENGVFPVKPLRGTQGDEELRPVCVRPGIGHRQNAGT